MSIVGRVLESLSRAANTGMHSSSDIPGLGASAEFTVFFWLEDLGGNSNDTLWADEDGGCQIFLNSSTSEVKARYSNSSSGGTGGDIGAGWNAIAVHFGLNIIGSSDVDVDVYRTASSDLDPNDNQLDSSSGGGPAIESDCTHYILGDDAGGGNTDDGAAARIANLCLIEGIWSLDELGVDTSTGQAKAFDSAAEAAIVYAIRGIEGTVGYDDSGNGNHFTVESSGVTHLETGLPPGMSLPGSGSEELTGLGVRAAGTVTQGAVTPVAVISGDSLSGGGALARPSVTPVIDLSGLGLEAGGPMAQGAVTPHAAVAGFGLSTAGELAGATMAPAATVSGAAAMTAGRFSPGSITAAASVAGQSMEATAVLGTGSVLASVMLDAFGLDAGGALSQGAASTSPQIAGRSLRAPGEMALSSVTAAVGLAGAGLTASGVLAAGDVTTEAVPALVGRSLTTAGVVGRSTILGPGANPVIHATVPAAWRAPEVVEAMWCAPRIVNARWRLPAEVAAEWKDVA